MRVESVEARSMETSSAAEIVGGYGLNLPKPSTKAIRATRPHESGHGCSFGEQGVNDNLRRSRRSGFQGGDRPFTLGKQWGHAWAALGERSKLDCILGDVVFVCGRGSEVACVGFLRD